MVLPFSREQFFEVFAAYNHLLWPFVLVLWVYAAVTAVWLARARTLAQSAAAMLALQWIWAGVVYHAGFFTGINPAAWLFSGLFVFEGGLLFWFGVVRNNLRFSATGAWRHWFGWVLIAYALIYPFLAQAEGHIFPYGPTFGVPCPTVILTVGWLFVVDRPFPRVIGLVPIIWALVGGSAALLLDVKTDVMLFVSGIALAGWLLISGRRHLVEPAQAAAFRH